jgi:NADH:ubiquinone oxidoreductase subunit 5 (subunit L)/multisubunit Na+/H+ antiporter MnhA subunit
MMRIFENIKNWANLFINMEDKKKQREIIIVIIYILTAILVIFSDQIFSMKTTTMFRPAGNIFENLVHIIIGGNFVYAFFLDFIKYELLSFLLDILYLFINQTIILDVENSLFNLNIFFWKNGLENILLYETYKYEEIYFKLNVFYHEYFSFGFYKAVLFRSNLPIFFYFGILFIFTTIFSLLLLSYYGFYGVFFLNLVTILLFWFSTIIYFYKFFIDNLSYKINLGKWFIISVNYTIFFEIFVDSISYSFMFLTLTIAVFVYIYTFSYFRYEPNVERLILLINCFVISMICLVTSGNFFVLFLGWELIGLTSFFLINFWSTRVSTLKSAFKAFVFNKFSDASLLIAILLVFFLLNEVSIQSFMSQISIYNNYYIIISNFELPVIEVISFFFIICAFIKSAQFGFHIWLPDSMEAPVPASALIHSATLVSAGVFLLLRLSSMFEYSIYSYYVVPIVGSFTAFFGGLCSIYQSDIKKILAYSTISHCGFLMVCYSTYIPEYTVLYLYIHGFFKAAVFLCVGNIIRFSRNYQDFRRMGMFWKYLPFECFASFICLINLCGLPFTIGFYIKHLLLIGVYMDFKLLYFILLNILGGAIAGLIYSFRLFYFVFFDFKKAKKIIYIQANRKNLNSTFYTNTTLASNIAIFSIIVVAYIVCIYMFGIFLNSSSLGEGLDIYSVNSSQYEEFNNPILTLINNIGYFNWILIIIIISLLSFSWRKVYKYTVILNFYSFFILFLIFFFIFYTIITL